MLALIIIIFFIIAIYCVSHQRHQYENSSYFQVTNNEFYDVKNDKCKHAEYLTWKSIRHLENEGSKFLFNLYIPTISNRTTEIDILMICKKGLFVIECKNFSGWIFGHETQKNWTQTLPQGRGRCHKEYFYNPIKQNAAHIKHLKNLIGRNIPIESIIVFSDNCVLKKITVNNNVSVIHHREIEAVFAMLYDKIKVENLTDDEVNYLYNRLYQYTQVSDETKAQHLQHVHESSYFPLYKAPDADSSMF